MGWNCDFLCIGADCGCQTLLYHNSSFKSTTLRVLLHRFGSHAERCCCAHRVTHTHMVQIIFYRSKLFTEVVLVIKNTRIGLYYCVILHYDPRPTGILAVSCRSTTHLITPTPTSSRSSIAAATRSTWCRSVRSVSQFPSPVTDTGSLVTQLSTVHHCLYGEFFFVSVKTF